MSDITEVTDVQGSCRMCCRKYSCQDPSSVSAHYQRVAEKSNCWRHFYDEVIKDAVISSSNSLDVCPQCLSTCEQLQVLDDRLEALQTEIDELVHQFTFNLQKSRKATSHFSDQNVQKVEPTSNVFGSSNSVAYNYEEYDLEDDSEELATKDIIENTQVKIVLERLQVGSDGRMIEVDVDEDGNDYIIEDSLVDAEDEDGNDFIIEDSTVDVDEKQVRLSDGVGYVCHVCGAVLASQRALDWHRKMHTDKKPFTCQFCDKSFRIRALLNRHMQCHSGERPFRCRCCGVGFATKYHFQRHTTSRGHLVHHKSVPNADTPIVLKTFKNLPTPPMKSYRSIKLSNDLAIRQRQLTKKIAEDSVRRITHGQTCRSRRKSGFHKCQVCAKVFTEAGKLTEHFRIHTGEKPFVCGYCHKDFRLRNFLIIHERIHTGERPFPCHICGMAFVQKSGLNDHCRTQKHMDKLQNVQRSLLLL